MQAPAPGYNVSNYEANVLLGYVISQLPPKVCCRFDFKLESDAFLIKPRLVAASRVQDESPGKRMQWSCTLEENFKVPEYFISHLCVVP